MKNKRVKAAYDHKWAGLQNLLTEKGVNKSRFELYTRVFKEENLLEAWVKSGNSGDYILLKTFSICAKSGVLGPKRRQGDGQVPEGFYEISSFQPQSSYHLALKVAYPNKSDRLKATSKDPGGDIMIHGNCVTIGCIPLAEAKNTFTPPDLYKGVEACVAQDNYNLAVRLFVLAGMYSWFDADRITDESAAQARTILITNTFAAMPEGKKAKFSEALDPLTKNPDPALVEKLCDEVEKVGAPNYYPSYMILHGIKAFTGNPHKEALIKDFGAATAWKSLQSEYLHCPD